MLRDIGEKRADLAQRKDIVERDLAASLLVVKDLQHPLAAAPKGPRPIAVVGREGSAGKADKFGHVAPGLTQALVYRGGWS
jgi:hypothetical protein